MAVATSNRNYGASRSSPITRTAPRRPLAQVARRSISKFCRGESHEVTGANARLLISRVVSSSLAAARATRLGMSTMCYPAVARVQSSVPTASVKFWDPEPATMSCNFELVHKNHDARERDARCSPRRRA